MRTDYSKLLAGVVFMCQACGPNEPSAIVNVTGWDDIAESDLRVQISWQLNDSTISLKEYPDLVRTKEFSIAIPTGESGRIAFTAIIRDSEGCIIAGGDAEIASLGPAPEIQKVTLPLAYYPYKGCDLTASMNKNLRDVWGFSASNVWAVGDSGTIIHWADGKWSSVSSVTSIDLYSIWGANENYMWAVGDFDGNDTVGTVQNRSTILRYLQSRWHKMDLVSVNSPGADRSLRAVYGSSLSDVLAVGVEGLILDFDGSSRWSPRGVSKISQTIRSIWTDSSANAWAVGDSGVITHETGAAWSFPMQGSENLRSIWAMNASSSMWIVGENNTFLRCDMPSGLCNPNKMGILPKFGKTEVVRDYFAVWGSAENNVWAVGEKGSIKRWDGTQWQGLPSDSAETLYSAWGTSDGQEVWIVGGKGTILHYKKH